MNVADAGTKALTSQRLKMLCCLMGFVQEDNCPYGQQELDECRAKQKVQKISGGISNKNLAFLVAAMQMTCSRGEDFLVSAHSNLERLFMCSVFVCLYVMHFSIWPRRGIFSMRLVVFVAGLSRVHAQPEQETEDEWYGYVVLFSFLVSIRNVIYVHVLERRDFMVLEDQQREQWRWTLFR